MHCDCGSACSSLFGIRPHSWEVLPARKDDGVVRGPMSDTSKPASAVASKNAKRRQKKAINAGNSGAQDQERGGGGGGGGGGNAFTETGTTQQDPTKKTRGLQKKLRQINQLKEKQASGQVLEANQISKIEAEASIRAELESLGVEM